MKKTFDINISGLIFHIDEDAYERLKKYMLALKNHFNSTESSNEIIADIEVRIAELMQEKLSENKQVVTIADINDIIAQMGSPEEIGNDDEDEAIHEDAPQKFGSKRLYRDIDNKILGGVASGLAAYFKGDPVWFRLGFVVILITGIGVLLYPILWLVTPAARTTAEKLEMRGQRVTVDTIEASIRNEFHDIRNNMNDLGEQGDSFQPIIDRALSIGGSILDFFWKAFLLIVKILRIFIGLVLIILGISLVVTVLVGLFGPDFTYFGGGDEFLYFSAPSFFKMIYGTGGAYFLALLTAMVLTIVPIIALIWGGIRLISKYKPKNEILGLPMLYVWLASAIIGILLASMAGLNFSESAIVKLSQKNLNTQNKTLVIAKGHQHSPCAEGENILLANDDQRICINDKDLVISPPSIRMLVSKDSLVHISLMARSQGKSVLQAKKIAQSINYSFAANDTTIFLNDFFTLPNEYKWRDQTLTIQIALPEGQKVITKKDITPMLHSRHWQFRNYDDDRQWIATDKEVSEIE